MTEKRYDLVSGFNAMALAGKDPNFVGGFHTGVPSYPSNGVHQPPAFPTPDRPSSSPGPYSRPPMTMPSARPQLYQPSHSNPNPGHSLTMQMAMMSTPALPTQLQGHLASPPKAPQPQSASVVPTQMTTFFTPAARPPRVRASSVPPPSPVASGSKSTDTVQCAGFTKVGPQCTRQLKPSATAAMVPGAPGERFCHQHSKEVLASSGFYARSNGKYLLFADWIPGYLQPETQTSLRVEMEKARTPSDCEGYIYCYEIRDSKRPYRVFLKVGRAVKLVKRLDQWGKQCGSKEPILRGWWPGIVVDDDRVNVDPSLMKGRVQAGEPGKWCHRLERLIHLELADLATHSPFLDPTFPNNASAASVAPLGPVSPRKKAAAAKDKPCADCGQMHKEIFDFERVLKGRYKGKEWDLLVRPVIEKWGAFVEAYV